MNNEPIYIDTNVIMDFILGRDSPEYIQNLFKHSTVPNPKITEDKVLGRQKNGRP
ncbi:MAG: hypothetical protein ACQEP1_02850 [Nanobdellota archaeon]